ncbi:hypothetical protein FPV67DRAFT_927638 [Lyophyllum atratum]|nr:hypothetical protein FPV67DRAFT_927638 [Lyophyllum atratum]
MEDYRENWDTGNPGPFSRLLEVLLGFSHRWRHLSVRLGYHHFCTLERVTPAAIPLLEEFSFEVPRPWNPSHIFLLSSIPLLHSPSLHTLSVYNLNWPMPLTLPLHWERLTRLFVGSRMLDGARLSPDQAMTILRRCGNLIACTIDIAVGGDEPEHRDLDTNDTIVLPFLDHLGVHFKYSTGMEIMEYELHELFNYLDSPMLRSLDVTGVNRLLHRIPFIPVLERQAGRLESLSFDINTMYTEDLKDILPLLSGIKRLHVDALFPWSWRKGENYPLNDSFLTILTPTPCSLSTSFCPLLEDINFRISPTSDVQDETILEFILARTSRDFAGIARLTRVDMTLGVHLVGFRPALQPIIEQGLEVRIDYHDPAIFGPEPIFQPYNSRSLEVARYHDHWAPGFNARYIDDNLEA